MHVRVVGELGPPGVKDKCRADAGAEMFGVGGDRAQSLGGDVEQKSIDALLVGVGDGADRCVAKAWRSECIETRLSSPAVRAAAWTARFSCRVLIGSMGFCPGKSQPPSGILP